MVDPDETIRNLESVTVRRKSMQVALYQADKVWTALQIENSRCCSTLLDIIGGSVVILRPASLSIAAYHQHLIGSYRYSASKRQGIESLYTLSANGAS
jgi:hypothetical protein